MVQGFLTFLSIPYCFQGAANSYQLPEDNLFDRWFASLLVLDEKEAHNLSCQLEPLTINQVNLNHSQNSDSKKHGGHRKSDSIASNSSSGAGSQFYCDIKNLSYRYGFISVAKIRTLIFD